MALDVFLDMNAAGEAISNQRTKSKPDSISPSHHKPENMEMVKLSHEKDSQISWVKICSQKAPGSSHSPLEINSICISYNEQSPPDLWQALSDSKARWTMHIYRPLYIERYRWCEMCKPTTKLVPVDIKIPSIEKSHLARYAQKSPTI